eukprot:10655404-Lingulodinium_polyedra.AAC.1
MGRTLGMDAGETRNHILESSAKEWTALPRERILLSTLPYYADYVGPIRGSPWDDKWEHIQRGSTPGPMMRAQGNRITPNGSLPAGPLYQCKATSLLYHLEPVTDPRPESERGDQPIPDYWHM